MHGPLFLTDDNPAPDAIHADYMQSNDGLSLRYAVARKDESCTNHGTVILLHGRNEAIEKYFETIRDLNKRGLTVASMDWRGQGASQRILRNRIRGYVGHFDDYCKDLEQFLTRVVLPDCPPPYYILAHSTGALVALKMAGQLQNQIRRMVLASPFLGLKRGPVNNRQIRLITACFSTLGMGQMFAGRIPLQLPPESFTRNNLTSDAARYQRNTGITWKYPQLGLDGPTMRWISNTLSAISSIENKQFHEGFSIPTLVAIAGNDRVVDAASAQRLAEKLRCAAIITIDGARHELMQEADFYREQFFAAFDAFIPGSALVTQASEPNQLDPALIEPVLADL